MGNYSNRYYSGAAGHVDIRIIERQRLQYRWRVIARVAGDVHFDRLHEGTGVETKSRQIIRLVLERDLFELPVAAIDARRNRQFALPDVAIAPLLWRLDHYGIELSKTAAPLMKYAERIFSRPAYIEALTPSEKVMRR